MTNEKIKRMFDAFYQAKRIRDMLPPLPQGVMPSYIQYLDVIHSLQREKKDMCRYRKRLAIYERTVGKQ